MPLKIFTVIFTNWVYRWICIFAQPYGEDSGKLHKYFGFYKVGTYHSTGYKCGVWYDVAWFEKAIWNYEFDPMPFMSIRDIDNKEFMVILDRHNRMANCNSNTV